MRKQTSRLVHSEICNEFLSETMSETFWLFYEIRDGHMNSKASEAVCFRVTSTMNDLSEKQLKLLGFPTTTHDGEVNLENA